MLQTKVLRVLEERSVERVGGGQPVPIDVRVVAATNRALPAATEEGWFQEELYCRLAVMELALPPLRERARTSAIRCHRPGWGERRPPPG